MFCVHLRRLPGNRHSQSHSLVTIFDLSKNDRAIGDLPNERAIEVLAIDDHVFESLERRIATNFVTVTKKMTKSVLRNTLSNFH